MPNKLILFIFLLLVFTNITSAMIINSVNQGKIFPGEETSLDLTIKNTINEDAEDVSLNLILTNLAFITISGSERSADEIREDRERTFSFSIKSSQDISPGSYNIPYVLSYTKANNEVVTKEGSIGVVVDADTELKFSTELENNVIGQKGKITLKIVNSGFGDVKFVNVKINPDGYTLLSSSSDYIGNIGSDDFETSNFDVIFNDDKPRLAGIVEYKDFNNKEVIENINIPINVYSKEEAIQLGVIKTNKIPIYVGILVFLIILFMVYRFIRRKMKKNKK